MKCELITYQHSANGLSLQLKPETEVERVLLKGLWRHGKLEVTHHDYAICWKQKSEPDKSDE